MQQISIQLAPELFYLAIKDAHQPFWLDSGMDPERLGRFSFLGCEPTLHFLMTKVDECTVTKYELGRSIDRVHKNKPLDTLDELFKARRLNQSIIDPNLPFMGGAVGYFSYDLKQAIEVLPQAALQDYDFPLAEFHFYDWVYVYDHTEKTGYLSSYQDHINLQGIYTKFIGPHINNNLESLQYQFKELLESKQPFISEALRSNMDYDTYIKSIQSVKDFIASGDVYQINFTQRFSAPFVGNDLSLYYQLRASNPAPFACLLKYDHASILSCSPERFIRVRGQSVETRPIKGTIARGDSPEQDEINRTTLLHSEKDRSELLMIVDLERNDLSKIAERGSVKVPELFKIESYPTVFHLVSSVTCQLRPNLSTLDIIRATFPGGSITGTPKIRAMQVIDHLEPTSRNLYTGSIGYISDTGDIDLNIVIRTLVIHHHTRPQIALYQVGGGIVWDSDPHAEFMESLQKGKALKKVLSHD